MHEVFGEQLDKRILVMWVGGHLKTGQRTFEDITLDSEGTGGPVRGKTNF